MLQVTGYNFLFRSLQISDLVFSYHTCSEDIVKEANCSYFEMQSLDNTLGR